MTNQELMKNLTPMAIFGLTEGDKIIAKVDIDDIPKGASGIILKSSPSTFFGTPKVVAAFGEEIVECLNYQIEKNN